MNNYFINWKYIIMTDPIQQTNSQQQWQQQWYTDDILGGENIFETIPEAMPEEDIPYGDMLEKKYQFDPIPEREVPAPTTPAPVAAPVSPSIPIVAPQTTIEKPAIVPDGVIENIVNKEMQDIQHESSLEETKVEWLLDTKLQTDIQKKFGEIFFTSKKIYENKTKLWDTGEYFDILWADNDKIFISYRFLIDESADPTLFITKTEQNKDTDEETTNELRFTFNEETSSLEVMVNDALIFDEIKDLTEDPKKKMQVVEKINKFIFLASEELRKLEKTIKDKEEEEKERKRLQEIFRNF